MAAWIDLWCVELDRPLPEIVALEASLSPDEVDRANRFRSPLDRRRFVARRGVLRSILGRYLDAAPEALRFAYGPHGKPSLRDRLLSFNLSKSGGLALYAVTSEPDVGCDIERREPDIDANEMAAQFFSPSEICELTSLAPALRVAAFYNGWTRKEAYLKAIGCGLSVSTQSFTTSLARRRRSRIQGGWVVHALEPTPSHHAAVVTANPHCVVNQRRWSFLVD